MTSTEENFLQEYKITDYEQPSVTVDIVPFAYDDAHEQLQILLVKRKHHPFQDYWALAGGFINSDESAPEAVMRETLEETGVKVARESIEQLYTFTRPGRDPRGWIMSIAYLAFLEEASVAQAADDAADAVWFAVRVRADYLELYSAERDVRLEIAFEGADRTVVRPDNAALAFDHDRIVRMAYLRIKNKLYYEPILLHALKAPFDLKTTNRLYQAFLGIPVEYENHCRKLKPYLEKVGKAKGNVGRAAFVYRLK